jgi:hypothetical protein
MKKILPLNVYAFSIDELGAEAQTKAVYEKIGVMLETVNYVEGSSNYRKAITEAERMRTPWFVAEYVYDYCKEEIMDNLRLNGDMFDSEGNRYPIRIRTDKNGVVMKHTYTLTPDTEITVSFES